MKKTEYKEIKRQYLPPEVQLIELEVEGVLNETSPNVSGGGMPSGDYDPEDPKDPKDPNGDIEE